MQAQLFWGAPGQVWSQINEWLKEHRKEIYIHFITQSESWCPEPKSKPGINLTIVIWYT